MIEELPVFEAWRDRKNLEIFASLNPKTPCRIELLAMASADDYSLYEIFYLDGRKADRSVPGWKTVYARKLNWIDKLRSKLS